MDRSFEAGAVASQRGKRRNLLASVGGGALALALIGGGAALAQEASDVEAITVVGSQIARSGVRDAIPVTVYGADQLDALSVNNGNDLIRSLPEAGDVTWHPTWLNGGNQQNAARGDVASINLRNLGASNTLLLVNGRRSVVHATLQTSDGGVSNVSYNANAIPTYGLERLEVLRDGAAALYGSDAIAGVVNIVTRRNLQGGGLQIQYGKALGTHVDDIEASGYFGRNFAQDRGNISVQFAASKRGALRVSDNWYTATADRRGFFPGTPLEGLSSLDTRATSTPWGGFFQVLPNVAAGKGVLGAGVPISQNGVRITGATGIFHIQPTVLPGSLGNLGNGLSTDDGQYAGTGDDRELRYETEQGVEINPATKRLSVFTTARYDLTDDIEAYGELGYYRASSRMRVASAGVSSTQPIVIPATAYWNPFGALYLPNGTLNPNRLQGLTGVPDSGLPIEIRNYRFADQGLGYAKVTNDQGRLLGGLKGKALGFDWDSALVYSWATADDVGRYLSPTRLALAISRSTPDAYNPFNGGDLSNYGVGDATPGNSDEFFFWGWRKTKTSLALWDLKATKPDLFKLWAGDVGVALGVEFRRETYSDDRDPSIDGTLTYTDWYSGAVNATDLGGTSPTPDSRGDRTVASAFAELAVPLVSPELNIPLVRSLELQLAGRIERYSDVGSVAKPKVAAAWGVFDGLTVRGSWSGGFKAPNLELINGSNLTRRNSATDWIRCEAQVRSTNPQYANVKRYADCANISFPTESYRGGNPNLKPEESTSKSVGFVFRPAFIPSQFGAFTVSADLWQIRQKNVIGILGEQAGLVLDAYYRLTTGQPYAAVKRAALIQEDYDLFAGTGLTPVGQVIGVDDLYQNLLPVTAKGLDLSGQWNLRGTRFGDFLVSVNASQLRSFKQDLLPILQEALAAQQAGKLDPAITVGTGGAEQVARNGAKPEWKVTSTFVWRYKDLTGRVSSQFIDDVQAGTWPDGSDFIAKGTTLYNASLQYAFKSGLNAEIGGRNIFDKDPPLNASGVYLPTLYQPLGRYLYVNLSKTF